MSVSSESPQRTGEDAATYRQQVEVAADVLREECGGRPSVGVLGEADLDGLLPDDSIEGRIPAADLPHFPASAGEVVFGTLGGTPVVELDRRLYLYEGATPREVTFPVRMFGAAGVDTLIVPAIAGSVNPQFGRGDLMLLTDHLNFQGTNPLVGPNIKEWGPRFPDMTVPYDPRLQQRAMDVARAQGLSLQKGVYLALLGPSFETTAEHRMARRLGADAVGASVVPEVIAARHMDLRVLAVALFAERHLSDAEQAASMRSPDTLREACLGLTDLLSDVVTGLETERSLS